MIFNLMKPVPTTESATWELLFEGEVIATASDSGTYNYCEITPEPMCFAYGCTYRVTVNGTVYELVADIYINSPCVGNLHLMNTKNEDTGEDFHIFTIPDNSDGGGMYFTFRNEGTYSIKVEKKLGCEEGVYYSWYGDDYYPNLPDRDKEVYPYVAIWKRFANTSYYSAYASKTPFVYDGEGFGIGSDTLKTNCSKLLGSMSADWDGWHETGDSIQATKLYWANHDVLNTDGTVYLAGTEPIPIN